MAIPLHARPVTRLFLVLSTAAAAVAGGDPPEDADAEAVREHAEAVLSAHTPQHWVGVRAFPDGRRPIGFTMDPPHRDLETASGGAMDLVFHAPAWFEPDRLLGVVQPRVAFEVRLLWQQVAPKTNAAADSAYTLELLHHKGYTRIEPASPPKTVPLRLDSAGNVAWTSHAFEAVQPVYPGLYDVFVKSSDADIESTPIGQVFLLSGPERRDDVRTRLTELYPQGTPAFAGHSALTPWNTARLELNPPPDEHRYLYLVTSTDRLASYQDDTDVAEITVLRENGARERYRLKLGRDTSHTLYALQDARIEHRQAPVAWRWQEESEDVVLEATVYRASFRLKNVPSPPTEIAIRYLLDEGVLRVRGIVFGR